LILNARHSPEPLNGIGVFNYIMKMTSHPLLSASERELAILAVGAHTGSVYELYAHSLVAQKIGISETQIKAAAEGKMPEGLNETEKAVFELSGRLVSGKGPLPDDVHEAASRLMGRDRVLVLIQLVAVYSYVCLILNAGAVGVPQEAVPGTSKVA
jgi:AhpD family alkylhydroperoxidase